MRRLLYLIIVMCTVPTSLLAQEQTPLLSALMSIEQSQSEYTIDIVSDGLEELTTTAKVEGLDAVAAVKRVCKGLPVKVKVHGRHIYVQHEGVKVERQLKLQGRVQDIRAHKDLLGATVVLMHPDSTVIEQKEAYKKWHAEGFSWETSEFSFSVPARPAKYLFRISLVGYQTTFVEYSIDKVGRREHERGLPPFYLAPQASTMKEVTVTASKVKFYYKGDTIIYNADAFILAEGSMLDALIKQLPGVEMKSDGRIYHEGKFVDDLLLNGKEFFRHDRKLMLENLPAYTVKDIAIYDKQTDENEWLGIKDERTQRHVIDVRLKKEYMVGWLVNVEAGGGTEERYLGRLFAMRHSDFSRIAIVANANNLDDDSRPGENDNWQRGKTNDLRRSERADIGGFVSDRNKRWEASGNISVNHQRTEGATRTVRQNYLSTGDTYDHSFTDRTGEDLHLGGWLSFYRNFKNVRWHIDPEFKYHHFNNSSDLASATFNAPVADVSRQLLDDLFSPNASRINLRDTLVNRILRQGSGRGHTWDATLHTGATVKIPYTNENLRLGAGINLIGSEERMFDRQEVRIADPPLTLPVREGVVTFEDEGTLSSTHSTPLPTREGQGGGSSSFHHLRDNHPTRDGKAYFNLGYNIPLGEGWRAIHATYYFEHRWQHHRSTLYLLEEQDPLLQDPPLTLPVREGVECSDWQSLPAPKVTAPSLIGRAGGGSAGGGSLLPSVTDYHQVMDRANSFDSHSRENRHKLDINLGYKFNKASYGQIWTLLNGDITLHHQGLDYQRGSIDTTLHRTAVTFNLDDNTFLDFKGGHQLGITMGIHETLPELEHRIDLRDDTDPMNVRLGNTRLRKSSKVDFGAYFALRSKQSFQRWEWHHVQTFNAVAMGYTYDTQTGARTYRPENVNGNYTSDGGYTFHHNFGTAQKVSIDLPLHLTLIQSVDMIGTAPLSNSSSVPYDATLSRPSPSTVHRLNLSFSPSVKADIGKQHLEFTCQPTWDRLTSDRRSPPQGGDGLNFSAFTCRTSLSAILKLPWKLDLSTDLNLYSRTGYADPQLNTNDFVWNARLSRPFFKGKFLVLIDGFDILGQLSNVTRTMNAQGRTETYTNVMPRYVLLHAVWRFNKQPKRVEQKQ